MKGNGGDQQQGTQEGRQRQAKRHILEETGKSLRNSNLGGRKYTGGGKGLKGTDPVRGRLGMWPPVMREWCGKFRGGVNIT